MRPGTPCSGSSPRTTASPARTSRPTSEAAGSRPRGRRLGVGGVLPGQAVGVRAGGWVRRGLLHVPRGRRPVLAARAGPGGGWSTCPSAEVTHRQGVSTDRHPLPDDRRAPPVAPALRRPLLGGLAPGAPAPGGPRHRRPGRPGLPGPGHPPADRALRPGRLIPGCRVSSDHGEQFDGQELDRQMGGARRHHGWWADLSRPDAGQLVRQPGRHLHRRPPAGRVQPVPAHPSDVLVGRAPDHQPGVARGPGHRRLRHHAAEPSGQHQHQEDRPDRQRQRRPHHRPAEQLGVREQRHPGQVRLRLQGPRAVVVHAAVPGQARLQQRRRLPQGDA